jgi:hypothetical protein
MRRRFLYGFAGLMAIGIVSANPPRSEGQAVYGHFDSTTWMRAGQSGGNTREGMAADLERHYMKLGMSREDVVALLGNPDAIVDGQYHRFRCVGKDCPLPLFAFLRKGR